MRFLLLGAALVLASEASAATFKIKAAGLNCNFCAFTIERLLGKIEGVDKKSIDVDVNTGLIQVSSTEGAFPAPQRLKEAIEKGGYSFRAMELEADGLFASISGAPGFRPRGAKQPIPLLEPAKAGKEGAKATVHATVELRKDGPVLKIEHFETTRD